MSKPLTVGTMVARLQEVATRSHLGLDTVVVLCEDEREYEEFGEVDLDQEENPENGAVVILKLLHPRQPQSFTFDKLDDEGKEAARDWWRPNVLVYDWWDHVFEDAVRMGKILGIEISKKGRNEHGYAIYFDLDRDRGCAIEAHYTYAKGALKKIMKEAPASWKDRKTGEVTECKGNQELHEVARKLQEAQRKAGYRYTARIEPKGRNINTEIAVYNDEDYGVGGPIARQLEEALEDFMHWILRTLEREQEYQLSDEQIDEYLISNGYLFNSSGERVG